MKDIEESTSKQQEHKAALQRFNKKWNLFKPKHRNQDNDKEKETNNKRKHVTTNKDLDHSGESREEPTGGNGAHGTMGKKSRQSTVESKTSDDKTETVEDKETDVPKEKQGSKELAEHRQNKRQEIHRNNGKRKERQRAEQGTDSRNAKRKLKRKTIQKTLTQYMNTKANGKRKREHTTHRNIRGEDIAERGKGQDKEETMRKKPRQTETTKRQGIG